MKLADLIFRKKPNTFSTYYTTCSCYDMNMQFKEQTHTINVLNKYNTCMLIIKLCMKS